MREWFSTTSGLKIVALIIATFTWFFVKAVTSDSRTVEGVPLEVKVRPGMAVTQSSVRTVNVTVRGTSEDLRLASRNELFAVVDLTDEVAVGRVHVPLRPDAIRHPRRVQVIAVEPTTVVVRIDKVPD
jgi:YbbR domain-containing protein